MIIQGLEKTLNAQFGLGKYNYKVNRIDDFGVVDFTCVGDVRVQDEAKSRDFVIILEPADVRDSKGDFHSISTTISEPR